MKRQLKIAFCTCVQLGLSCINAILSIGGKLDLLITLRDDLFKTKSGRIFLDEVANNNNIPLVKIKNINDEEIISIIKKEKIDWLFIIGWSQIAKKDILNAPKYGCIGMHPTLLPKGRGRASIPWAILKGLDKTGVTMFKLDEGVDTGDIIGQKEIYIKKDINATELYDLVNEAHIELIKSYWEDIVLNNIKLIKQNNNLATEWPGRKPEDGLIDKNMDVFYAERLVRAVTKPYPGAFIINEDGSKTIIWSAHVSNKFEKESIELKNGFLVLDQTEKVF